MVSAPTVTVGFVDVAGFGDLSSEGFAPREIMTKLAMLFARCDAERTKFGLCSRVKTIGECYMFQCGLFSADGDPGEHAQEAVRYAVELLRCTLDLHPTGAAELKLRVGIHTGGPVWAGLTSIERPVFDVLGATVAIAARLQETTIPGRAQISEPTAGFVHGLDVNILLRGDVSVGAMGTVRAYLVTPRLAFTLQADSRDWGGPLAGPDRSAPDLSELMKVGSMTEAARVLGRHGS